MLKTLSIRVNTTKLLIFFRKVNWNQREIIFQTKLKNSAAGPSVCRQQIASFFTRIPAHISHRPVRQVAYKNKWISSILANCHWVVFNLNQQLRRSDISIHDRACLPKSRKWIQMSFSARASTHPLRIVCFRSNPVDELPNEENHGTNSKQRLSVQRERNVSSWFSYHRTQLRIGHGRRVDAGGKNESPKETGIRGLSCQGRSHEHSGNQKFASVLGEVVGHFNTFYV